MSSLRLSTLPFDRRYHPFPILLHPCHLYPFFEPIFFHLHLVFILFTSHSHCYCFFLVLVFCKFSPILYFSSLLSSPSSHSPTSSSSSPPFSPPVTSLHFPCITKPSLDHLSHLLFSTLLSSYSFTFLLHLTLSLVFLASRQQLQGTLITRGTTLLLSSSLLCLLTENTGGKSWRW